MVYRLPYERTGLLVHDEICMQLLTLAPTQSRLLAGVRGGRGAAEDGV